MDKEAALVEAVLFLETEPMDTDRLAKITLLNEDAVRLALEHLHARYSRPDSGLELSEIGGGFSLIPRRDLMLVLRHHYGKKTDEKMSRAALETLSIVAYSQPVTRIEIDSIRGVNSAGTLKVLLDRGFIRETGRKDTPGRPVQYGTTKEFLQLFGLASIADLPKLDEAERERFELKRT
ncbi:MAG TPA: SMC-Scp complex subunit ScpB [Spirochaetia bacterium]|nr:SMC-Scp complex subunit ScpB [Spirochaetia bacterium]